MKWRRKPKLLPILPCDIEGCTLPGLVRLGRKTFCLTHIRRFIRGHRYLDAVATEGCKAASEKFDV
jgi:hypothetical protein